MPTLRPSRSATRPVNRYDAARAAYASAEASLKAAQARGTKKPKPVNSAGSPDDRGGGRSPGRPSVASCYGNRGCLGASRQPTEGGGLDLHTVLDVLGVIPLVGAAADAANGLLYAAEGDWGNAALSAASAVPLLGDAAAAAKLGVKAVDVAGTAAKGHRAVSVAEAASVGVKNGETAATALGKATHRTWDYGPGFEKEFRLPSGQRPDAINFSTREVVESKPNNPRSIRLGQTQLNRYLSELNATRPGDTPWTGRVVTYP